MAEPPVETLVLFRALLGCFDVFGGRDDDTVVDELVIRPSGRDRALLVGDLEGSDRADDLVDVPPDLLRVVEDYTDYAVGIDYERGTDGVGSLAGMDHPQP